MATTVTIVDEATGAGCSVSLESKPIKHEDYAVKEIADLNKRMSYLAIRLRIDNESWLVELARAVKTRCKNMDDTTVDLEAAPRYVWQSLGSAGAMQWKVCEQARVVKSDLGSCFRWAFATDGDL